MLEEELLLLDTVNLLGIVQYGAITSERNKILEHMRQIMMCILTDADEEANTDKVETVILNGREDVVEAKYDKDNKDDVVEVVKTVTGNYSTARAGLDDETL